MKTIEKIIKSRPVYLHDWKDSKKFGVIKNFEGIYEDGNDGNKMKEAIKKWKGIHVLFASYTYEWYSGRAFVLFEEKGKLYEAYGSHCSCNGLEYSWSPEKCVLKELSKRIDSDYEFEDCRPELKKFLGVV